MNDQMRAAVTVSEMARMVGLSRARFYQLVEEGIFPPPVYCVRTKRPHYDEELQKVCLEVRYRNCGVNGRPVLFYSVRHPVSNQSRLPKKVAKPKKKDEYPEILAAVRTLGLPAVTGDQVTQVVRQLYPNGVGSVPQPEVIRAVFLYLQRRDRADSVGR